MDATQTPATPADSILSIEAVAAFFEAHGIKSFPIAQDIDSLEAFKAEQNEHWTATLESYQKLKAAWSKARSELDRALGAKAPKEELIEELTAAHSPDSSRPVPSRPSPDSSPGPSRTRLPLASSPRSSSRP
jgi:hypothetical protein